MKDGWVRIEYYSHGRLIAQDRYRDPDRAIRVAREHNRYFGPHQRALLVY